MRVNASPALDPNGLDPPTPPKAPARPPPLPRWIRTKPIMNRPVRMTSRFKKLARNAIGPPPVSMFAVNSKYTGGTDADKSNPRPRQADDREKKARFQPRTADERSVHIGLCEQFAHVLRLGTAAVLDRNPLGCRPAVQSG